MIREYNDKIEIINSGIVGEIYNYMIIRVIYSKDKNLIIKIFVYRFSVM